MTTPSYLRCTLRLAPSGGRSGDAVAVAPEPFDDWSGAAAFAHRPDSAALDYAHPAAVARVQALQPAGWQEEDDGDTIVFWLEEGSEAEGPVAAVLVELARLGSLNVQPERPGWDDAWKEFHTPHTVGRVYLRPPWSPARDDHLDVVVDAGQAFGTGGHATTRQCVAALQEIAPRSLLDCGCGSGVVSLAAIRLGFAPVWGVDIDPAAVEAARENAERNELNSAFFAGDVTDPALALPAAGVVVANIALRPILSLARRFHTGEDRPATALRPAHLLLAGLLVEQGEEATAAFPGYRMVSRLEEDVWLLLHLVPA